MKAIKTLLILSFFTLLLGCSTNTDSNGNTTTTVIPLAPTNLTGSIVANQVVLMWTDNSTNETGYKIDRKMGTGNWVEIVSVSPNIVTYNDAAITVGTTYSYRVYSFNSVGNSLNYSNVFTITIPTPATLATLSTTIATSITNTAATSGGNITFDGGTQITGRGVVWSTSPNPTITLTTKTTDGSGIGSFTSLITGLTSNTNYYVKAYATNSVGTSYGNEIIFQTIAINVPGPNVTDINGTIYQSVTNCNQTWTKTNLSVTAYSDGSVIPQVTDPTQWTGLTTGAWCYYNNDPANNGVYGKLYNWYAAAGIYNTASLTNPALRKKLAPTGWHVPTYAEWTSLVNCLGGNAVAGGKMKETGTTHWLSPNTGATNQSGFTALPAGERSGQSFYNIGSGSLFWTQSDDGGNLSAFAFILGNNNSVFHDNYSNSFGNSIRCVRD